MMKFVIVLSLICSSQSARNPDEIKKLPGLKSANFRQYSGYLNATDGKFLHYWFVESQRSPTKDPVLLWMNGGTGCSALMGFLSELGPFHVNEDGTTLYDNPYSWNKVANIIFLEAPAGVGFSFSTSGNYSTDDDTVSLDYYTALKNFFLKFPQFKKNDFYVTGQSYAGMYVPTVALRVQNGSDDINLKGFAIGNGYLDLANWTNSLVFYSYYHGLVGPSLWGRLTKYCCNGTASPSTCDFVDQMSTQCSLATEEVSGIVFNSGLNFYNLYQDCDHPTKESNNYSLDKQNLWRLFLGKNNHFHTLYHSIRCINSSRISYYLNQKSVRRALHIPSSFRSWELCSNAVQQGYNPIYTTMRPQILQLINSGKVKGLIYNGDVDMASNFLGNEWFTSNLNLSVIENYGTWKYKNQIAGLVQYYRNLVFLTIKGAGHMAPQDKPGPALKMITDFLKSNSF